ncbi:type ISP restriction/modification enzyme [Streptomyces winkii]|uniref:type ISP restriction/modification enzyme n=1 Tax=Streptomyces winkii TaxID=3051178 RepID=UPI0028D2342F|nr:type ISP restriction/modification enzyme [Streptomyces sp. DSM 40971]
MPWSVPPLRLGRGWVAAPDAASLRARWNALVRTEDEAERAALFGPSRSRTPRSAVAPLPGMPAHRGRLAQERGDCPEPVRILHGPYDQQWLIPDHRLIDAARPQLWRVSDGLQTHLVETAHDQRRPGPLVAFTALLPDGQSPAGRPGRVRPLYRRPGGREPNVLPGLLDHLAGRLGVPVTPEDMLAWTAAAVRPGPAGRAVPLTYDPGLWRRGVALGRRLVWLHTRGARCAGEGEHGRRPRLPGGHRPYVRAPLPASLAHGEEAGELVHDAEEHVLHIGEGRVAPVAPEAWEFEAGGARVLETWFAQRAGAPAAAAGTLSAVRPRNWPQEWTSELLELITVLTLLAELRPEQRDLAQALEAAEGGHGRAELARAGLLPPPAACRRPASVLDVPEEGPEGQLALL